MDLSFPIPVIGKIGLSILNGLSGLHFDWLVSLALQTITRIETEEHA